VYWLMEPLSKAKDTVVVVAAVAGGMPGRAEAPAANTPAKVVSQARRSHRPRLPRPRRRSRLRRAGPDRT
jgi:hypothetical protein